MYFFDLHLLNGKLYAIVQDCLCEVDLFEVTEITDIPDIQSSGYCRSGILEDQLIVTNEKEFFVFNG